MQQGPCRCIPLSRGPLSGGGDEQTCRIAQLCRKTTHRHPHCNMPRVRRDVRLPAVRGQAGAALLLDAVSWPRADTGSADNAPLGQGPREGMKRARACRRRRRGWHTCARGPPECCKFSGHCPATGPWQISCESEIGVCVSTVRIQNHNSRFRFIDSAGDQPAPLPATRGWAASDETTEPGTPRVPRRGVSSVEEGSTQKGVD
jgi:hypothetical protein